MNPLLEALIAYVVVSAAYACRLVQIFHVVSRRMFIKSEALGVDIPKAKTSKVWRLAILSGATWPYLIVWHGLKETINEIRIPKEG